MRIAKVLRNKGISNRAVAALLNISEKTAYNKLHGDTEFTISEALAIKREFCPEFDLEYLYEPEDEE